MGCCNASMPHAAGLPLRRTAVGATARGSSSPTNARLAFVRAVPLSRTVAPSAMSSTTCARCASTTTTGRRRELLHRWTCPGHPSQPHHPPCVEKGKSYMHMEEKINALVEEMATGTWRRERYMQHAGETANAYVGRERWMMSKSVRVVECDAHTIAWRCKTNKT